MPAEVTGNGALYALIIACEVAFWLALAAGLATRYLFRRPRLSTLLLLCVPLIDAALLAVSVLHLRNGATATFAHGLAMAYIAFTVAFGPMVVSWADRHFAHRFAGAPPPPAAPGHGWPALLYELKLWARCFVAIVILYALLTAVLALVNDPAKTQALEIWYRIPLGTLFFWFLFGPLWTLVFSWRQPKQSRPH